MFPWGVVKILSWFIMSQSGGTQVWDQVCTQVIFLVLGSCRYATDIDGIIMWIRQQGWQIGFPWPMLKVYVISSAYNPQTCALKRYLWYILHIYTVNYLDVPFIHITSLAYFVACFPYPTLLPSPILLSVSFLFPHYSPYIFNCLSPPSHINPLSYCIGPLSPFSPHFPIA